MYGHEPSVTCVPGGIVKSYLSLSSIAVRTLEYTTEEVAATWLLPEMVLRVANMLNYFLQFLTGTMGKADSLSGYAFFPLSNC